MRIKRFDTYRLSVLASVILIYELIVDGPSWLIYLTLGIVLAERAFIALLLYYVRKIQKEMAIRLMKTLEEAQRMNSPIVSPFDQDVE